MQSRTLEIPHVETPTCEWADKHAIRHRKLNGEGKRSWPDRIFFFGQGHVFLVEFKRPGKKPDTCQQAILDDLKSLGHDVGWFNNKEDAIMALRRRLVEYGTNVPS